MNTARVRQQQESFTVKFTCRGVDMRWEGWPTAAAALDAAGYVVGDQARESYPSTWPLEHYACDPRPDIRVVTGSPRATAAAGPVTEAEAAAARETGSAAWRQKRRWHHTSKP